MFRVHGAHHQERQILSIQRLVTVILCWWPRCVQVGRRRSLLTTFLQPVSAILDYRHPQYGSTYLLHSCNWTIQCLVTYAFIVYWVLKLFQYFDTPCRCPSFTGTYPENDGRNVSQDTGTISTHELLNSGRSFWHPTLLFWVTDGIIELAALVASHTFCIAAVFQMLLDGTSAFYIDFYAGWLASWKCDVSEMLVLNKWKKKDWSRGCAPCCVPYLSKQTRQAAGNINGPKYQRRQQTKVRIYSTCIFVTKNTAMLSYCTTRTGFQHWIRFISVYSVMSSPLS